MPLLSASADTFILGIVFLAVVVRRKYGGDNIRPRFRSITTTFVALHSIYILHILCFLQPPNIFTRLHIPLSTPSERIRALILKQTDGRLPDRLEQLLTRLSSFDLRTFFIRFGQDVVQNCDYCHTFGEYALYALPGILLLYLREAAVIGLVTVRGTHREPWRMYGVGLLLFAAVVEIYWILSVNIQISGGSSHDIVMWHDKLWTVRHLFFLLLPLATHFLCTASVSISPLAVVPMTNLALQSLNRRLRLLRFTNEATSRVPEFRQAAGEFWERQRSEGRWAREDEGVNRTADFAGIPLQAEGAKRATASLKQGLEPDVFVMEVR